MSPLAVVVANIDCCHILFCFVYIVALLLWTMHQQKCITTDLERDWYTCLVCSIFIDFHISHGMHSLQLGSTIRQLCIHLLHHFLFVFLVKSFQKYSSNLFCSFPVLLYTCSYTYGYTVQSQTKAMNACMKLIRADCTCHAPTVLVIGKCFQIVREESLKIVMTLYSSCCSSEDAPQWSG